MIPVILRFLQNLNDPVSIVRISFLYVASYYIVSALFHYVAAKGNESGFWKKNGAFDVITSVVWCFCAVALIASLLDLVVRNELSLRYLVVYYVLLLLCFAFVYNIINRHFPNAIQDLSGGWAGELQCLTMSIQVMTTGDYTSAKPAKPVPEFITALQALLGLVFVAVFIAKAVALLTPAGLKP